MSKYIIEIEDKPVGGLYKAKAFRTLVFDEEGLRRLEKLEKLEKHDKHDKHDVETYFYVNDHFTVGQAVDTGSEDDMIRKELGNYFKSFGTALEMCARFCDCFEWRRETQSE